MRNGAFFKKELVAHPKLIGSESIQLEFRGKFFTGLEFGNLSCFDLDYFTCLRVATVAGSSLRYGKRTESNQGDFTTTFQRFGNGFYEGIQGGICLGFGDTSIIGHLGDQFSFVHGLYFLEFFYNGDKFRRFLTATKNFSPHLVIWIPPESARDKHLAGLSISGTRQAGLDYC